LRPALGHPAQQVTLASLCEQEDDRHENSMGAISAYTKAQQALRNFLVADTFMAIDVYRLALKMK